MLRFYLMICCCDGYAHVYFACQGMALITGTGASHSHGRRRHGAATLQCDDNHHPVPVAGGAALRTAVRTAVRTAERTVPDATRPLRLPDPEPGLLRHSSTTVWSVVFLNCNLIISEWFTDNNFPTIHITVSLTDTRYF